MIKQLERFYVFMCDEFNHSLCLSIFGDEIGDALWLRYCAYTPDVLGWFMCLSDENKLDLVRYVDGYGNKER